jgi:serine/threonine protein phosphatase PrpC
LVRAGVSEDEARQSPEAHQLTGWLGADADPVTPHVTVLQPADPGWLVICTDGLWNYAPGADGLAALVEAAPGRRPIDIARHLVEAALEAGGHDNITVAVMECNPHPPGAAGA